MTPSAERTGFIFAAATIGLWAGFVLVSRLGGTSALNPFDITALRFGTAALVLLPAWLLWRRVPLFTARMFGLALVGGIGYSLMVYAGFRYAPAAHGALLVSGLLPFSIAVLAWLALGEAPRRQMKAGLALIAGGVACLAFDTFYVHGQGGAGTTVLFGDLLLVAASLCWAVYTVLVRRWGYGPWETTIGVALLTALLYLPAYLLWLPQDIARAATSDIALQAFYQGILVVIVAMVSYMQAMARLGPARVGAMMAVVPAFAGVGVSLLLAEPLSGWVLGGLVLTSVGAWVGVRQ